MKTNNFLLAFEQATTPTPSVYMIGKNTTFLTQTNTNTSKLAFLLMFACLCFGYKSANAQLLSTYGFASTSGIYTPITGGTIISSTTCCDDDNIYASISLGFSFTFGANVFNSIRVSPNGFMQFSNGDYICGFEEDLRQRSTPTIGTVRVQVIGVSPNQVCVIQYENWGRVGGTRAAEIYNFQIRLTETTNAVAVVYGAMTTTTINNFNVVGLRSSTNNADFNTRSVVTDWATSTVGTSAYSFSTTSPTIFPANGLTYTWTPPSLCTPITITPTLTPQNYVVGTAIPSITLSASGVTGATYTYAVTNGVLPAGVTLVSNTISGTPTTALASGTFTITATSSIGACTGTAVYNFAVACSTITITPTLTTQNYVVGTAISNITLGASGVGGATYTYAVTSDALPAGVTLASGVISGTPTTALASGTFTITATSSIGACTRTQIYNYTVVCPTLVFTNITVTGGTVGSFYTLNAGVTGNTQAVVYTVSSLPLGLTIASNTGLISGTPTVPVASTTYTVTATQGTCSVTQAYTFAVACVGITITPLTLANGTVGTVYTQTATQTGLTGTPVWSVSGTPPNGLNIDAGTGIISGTPTMAGTFPFVVSVTDGACSQTKNYSVAIACPTLVFTNTTATSAIVSVAYTLNAGVTGNTGTIVYSVLPALPAGLSLNTATGVISGAATTITASASYVVTARQTVDCANTQTYTFGVVPNCTPVVLGLASIPNATIGTPYSHTFTATGGATGATYTFATTSPQLSVTGGTGLTLSAAGILSGNPTFSTSITFRVTVTTPNNCTGFKDYTIVINPNPTTAIDNSLADMVKVYPNPSSGDFNIDLGGLNAGKSSVCVYDMQGKVVFTSENNVSGNLMVISLEKFASGIYLMEVKTSKGRILKRLAKQ